MTAEIIYFERFAGRSSAMHNRRVQRELDANPIEMAVEMARAREPESLTQSDQEMVLQFVMAFQPSAIARWIMANATEAGLATLIGEARRDGASVQ